MVDVSQVVFRFPASDCGLKRALLRPADHDFIVSQGNNELLLLTFDSIIMTVRKGGTIGPEMNRDSANPRHRCNGVRLQTQVWLGPRSGVIEVQAERDMQQSLSVCDDGE